MKKGMSPIIVGKLWILAKISGRTASQEKPDTKVNILHIAECMRQRCISLHIYQMTEKQCVDIGTFIAPNNTGGGRATC